MSNKVSLEEALSTILKMADNFKDDKKEDSAENNSEYQPKLFGESKSVTYELDLLCKSFCQVTEWPNGEGFNIDVTEDRENKCISLHTSSVECILSCLKHLGFLKSYKLYD